MPSPTDQSRHVLGTSKFKVSSGSRMMILSIVVGALIGLMVASYIISYDDHRNIFSQAYITHVSDQPSSYSEVIDSALPSVVSIYVIEEETGADPSLASDAHYLKYATDTISDTRGKAISLGSGVIVSDEGYIVTNFHVIQGAQNIVVDLADGRSSTATIIGTDPATDLAVMKIDLPDLKGIKIPSENHTRTGDVVFVIGNPHGLGSSVAMGIVSATDRNQLGINTFENFIQTDAPINRGNSGGALINSDGQLIGINTAFFLSTYDETGSRGIGLAIPIDRAKDIINLLIHHGKITRGWLGIELQLRSQQGTLRDNGAGFLLTSVFTDGPGHNAGLLPGDIITHFDHVSADTPSKAINYIGEKMPGSTVHIQYLRYGQTHSTLATLGTRPTASH